MLIDTHCHVHWVDFPIPPDEVIKNATAAGVMQMICVGTDEKTSLQAIEFAKKHDEAFATIGLHPHYAKNNLDGLDRLVQSVYFENGFVLGSIRAPASYQTRAADVFKNKGVGQDSSDTQQKVIAIGEIGLDYYYNNSSRDDQISALERQIELAGKYDLPIIFHVRDGYDDFWPILDNFQNIRGVAHSFTDTIQNSKEALKRGLYIGVNGISTFTKDSAQQEMYASLPLDRILLETDAPYLTPSPLRGKIKCNEPAYIREIAQHMSAVRQIEFDEVARVTTQNARALFNL